MLLSPIRGGTSSRTLEAAVDGRNFDASPEYIFHLLLPLYFDGPCLNSVCFKIHKALTVQPCVLNFSEYERVSVRESAVARIARVLENLKGKSYGL